MNLLGDPDINDLGIVQGYDFGAAFNADHDETGFTTLGAEKTPREMVDRYLRPMRGSKNTESFNQFVMNYPKSWTVESKEFWKHFATIDEDRIRDAVKTAAAEIEKHYTRIEMHDFLADRLFSTN